MDRPFNSIPTIKLNEVSPQFEIGRNADRRLKARAKDDIAFKTEPTVPKDSVTPVIAPKALEERYR
jgi:hypothetical protein